MAQVAAGSIDFGLEMPIFARMNVALTTHFEGYIQQLITTGRYSNASEVVRAGLRKLQESEGEIYPPGSLKHLYNENFNRAESKIARKQRVPLPDEV